MAIAARAASPRPVVHVYIDDLELCLLLKERAPAAGSSPVEFLNVHECAPPALLAQFAPIEMGDDGAQPHLVVVGVGSLGERLIAHAAAQWRLTRPDGAGRLRLDIVDAQADVHRQAIVSRYPGIADVCDLVVHRLDPAAATAGPALAATLASAGTPTAVFVCLDDDARGLQAALAVRRLRSGDVPIVVCTTGRGRLADLLGAEGARDLHGFPLLERACRAETLVRDTSEKLARTIHATYVRRQKARGATVATNPSLVPWADLPQSLKDSNLAQAADIPAKLAAVGCRLERLADWDAPPVVFTDEEVERLARREHDRWVAERRAAGWVPGPVKDTDRKISPYLVPWEELSEDDSRTSIARRCAPSPRSWPRPGSPWPRQVAPGGEVMGGWRSDLHLPHRRLRRSGELPGPAGGELRQAGDRGPRPGPRHRHDPRPDLPRLRGARAQGAGEPGLAPRTHHLGDRGRRHPVSAASSSDAT